MEVLEMGKLKISEQVENILKFSKDARNSDKELIILYMQKFGMDLTPQQIQTFREMPSTETIRRVRQQLQEQGKYEADDSVNEARYNKFTKVRANIKSENAESLIEKQGYKVLPWGE